MGLIVTVGPDRAGALHVTVRPSPSTGVVGMADSFASGSDEAFRGFGGRHLDLDQRGRSFYNWTNEENFDARPFDVPGAQGGTLLYPNGPEAAYYPQASFVSSRPHGFLLDRPELARFHMASDRPDAWQADVAARRLDYVVAPGSAPRAIATLTAITGRQRAPPAWAVRPGLDRETQLGQSAASYLRQVRRDLRDIDRYRLPLGSYRIEGWQILTRSALRGIIRALHRRGIKALVYLRCFVAEDVAATEAKGTFAEAVAKRLDARTKRGAPYYFGNSFGGKSALLDFTNPATLRWWRGRVRAALELGADGFMQDFGEETQPGMRFYDGETGATMHNRYPIVYGRATRRVIDEYERDDPRRSVFFFTRAGYTGRPGSAAYESANFPGDETTDWSRSSGIASVAPDMLNRAVGGAYGSTTDIGGYFDVYTGPTSKELFLRWAQLTALTPFFRLHGSLIAGVHTPWSYDAQTVRLYNALSRLHELARPLILRLWREAVRTGVPPTRPLWLAHPGDRRAARQDQEWLLGPDVLVAPVVSEGARSRGIYFPRGCWRQPDSGQVVSGPRMQSIAAPLARLPYFVRCGTRPFARGS